MVGRSALVVLVVLAAPLAGRADDPREAIEHAVKGGRAYDLGAYDEAIQEFASAYRLRDDPALLYNLAQAHRLAGHSAEALRFYRVYLIRMPNAPNRSDVEGKIVALQRVIGMTPTEPIKPAMAATTPGSERKPAPAAPREPEPSSPAPSSAAPSSAAPSSPAPSSPAPSSPAPQLLPSEPLPLPPPPAIAPVAQVKAPPKPRVPLGAGVLYQRAGIGAGAAGVALVVGGIVCGALAQRNADDITALAHRGGTFVASKESSGQALQAAEGALIAIGGAAVVTGVVLFVVGRQKARRAAASHAGLDGGFATAAATAFATASVAPALVRF
jgi:tetratricopeptide (TPR) repeat protein